VISCFKVCFVCFQIQLLYRYAQVCYDDPGNGARHTLAVARVVLDADHTAPAKAFAAAIRLLSTRKPAADATASVNDDDDNCDNDNADNAAAAAADDAAADGGGASAGGVGYGAGGTPLRACVDRFVATVGLYKLNPVDP
jgi:hypothetical protein